MWMNPMSRERPPFNIQGLKKQEKASNLLSSPEWPSLLEHARQGEGGKGQVDALWGDAILTLKQHPSGSQKTQALCVPSSNSVDCSVVSRPAAPPRLSATWFGSPLRLQPLCCSNLPKRSTSADVEGRTLRPRSAEVDMPAIWARGFTMPILPHSSGHCKAGSQERTDFSHKNLDLSTNSFPLRPQLCWGWKILWPLAQHILTWV